MSGDWIVHGDEIPDSQISVQRTVFLRDLLSIAPYRAKLFNELLVMLTPENPPWTSALIPLCKEIDDKILKPMFLVEMYANLDNVDAPGPLSLSPNVINMIPYWALTMMGLICPGEQQEEPLARWIQRRQNVIAERSSRSMAQALIPLSMTPGEDPMAHVFAMTFLQEFRPHLVYRVQKEAGRVLHEMFTVMPLQPRRIIMRHVE
ncbi:Fc.00g027780.m01.CDS01 [Cosmosporella sp. VM-42]